MSQNKKESELKKSLEEKEHEKYSFYKIYDLVFIVLKLMNAYESEKYDVDKKKSRGNVIIKAAKPTSETKQVTIDTSILNYRGLQLEHDFHDTLELYGFGPSQSRFKLDLKDVNLDYIQDFADVLYEYRSENEITNLSQKELEELLNKYLEISQEEIECRKSTKTTPKQTTKK